MNKYILLIISFIIYSYQNILLGSAIEVSPTKIFMQPGQKFSSITVKNLSDEKVYFQAEQLDWQQQDGKNIYQPSNNIIISPLIFSVDSKKEQILRLGIRTPISEHKTEKSYRLLLSEIPDQYKAKHGLKMVLRFSIPIFIEPDIKTEHELQWSKKIKNNTDVILSIYNPNNYHKMINKIELKDKLNKELYNKQNAFIYLLPQQKYTWTIANNPKLVEHIKGENKNSSTNIAMTLNTANGLSNAIAANEPDNHQNLLLSKSDTDIPSKNSNKHKTEQQS